MSKKLFVVLAMTLIACTLNGLGKRSNSKAVIIGLGGDTMIGRMVNENLKRVPPENPWGNLLPLLLKPDITLINLETTFTTEDRKPVPKVFNFRSDPKNVAVLNAAQITVVNVANNHIKDFGDEGMFDTLKTLDHANIMHVGAGSNASEAQRPTIVTKRGLRIGIIGATDNEPGWRAQKQIPGVNYFDVEHPEPLLGQIKKLKQKVDIVVVSLHWGPNMRERPTEPYIKAAHAMIEAGADVIHGHSAHIFQAIELYKNKIILYDTGDLVDDYHVDEQLLNDHSFFFVIEILPNKRLSLQVVPTLISDLQVNKAQQKNAAWSLKRLQTLSRERGTFVTSDGLVNRTKPIFTF